MFFFINYFLLIKGFGNPIDNIRTLTQMNVSSSQPDQLSLFHIIANPNKTVIVPKNLKELNLEGNDSMWLGDDSSEDEEEYE